MYDVVVTSRAQRELDKLSSSGKETLEGVIENLRANPRPAGIRKLHDGIHRIRVGNWRVIFAIDDKFRRVIVLKIVRRSEDTYDKVRDLL